MTPTRHLAPVALLGAALLLPALGTSAAADSAPSGGHDLGLGADGQTEARHTRVLQPGVRLTTIVRGRADPRAFWTVEVTVPAGSGSPDPDAAAAAVTDRQSADEAAATLRDAGLHPRVEGVRTERVADYGGFLGYRVRVGRFADDAGAERALGRVHRRTDLDGAAVFSGWDPRPDSTGPWRLRVLTVDPDTFEGSLAASYGPDLERRERTSELAAQRAATAGVNAGFFVFDPAAGAPGDPAGAGAYAGRLESEPVAGRPALVLDSSGDHADVVRLGWRGSVTTAQGSVRLDGINRVPGLVRNCGGLDDQPTTRPLHDVTCTDDEEVVRFTGAFGAVTPQGPGAEAVLDARGVVVAMRSRRGGPVPPDGSTLQATGSAAEQLRDVAPVGSRPRVRTRLRDDAGRVVTPTPRTAVLNGGPELVEDGAVHATPRADGMVHPGEPGFYYAWAHKRNPRTFAGVDAGGRLIVVTADGRSTRSLGLSVAETARVARDLGMRDAVNLDGGGSTTMVADGRVVNDPSDAEGERPVGDALLVLPR